MHSLGEAAGTSGAAAEKATFRSPETVLRASSVALVGASERGQWQRMIYGNLRDYGYPGRVLLVNPRQKEVYGQPCFPSLRELPEPVDHAMVIVPAVGVADVLKDAEAAGVKSATVYAAAMGDGEDPDGCIFQSGGTLQFWLRTGADRGLRFSYGITSGKEADLDLADYLNFLIDDPHTRQIVLFIEGIRRPSAFMQAAGRALAAGKPVLAIKTGATAKSQSAAQSHTGAMCGRYGIVNCRSLDDMLETALAFDGGRLPKGPRIGFVTTSGGTVDLLYDYAESEGATMPDFSEETHAALMPFVQEG